MTSAGLSGDELDAVSLAHDTIDQNDRDRLAGWIRSASRLTKGKETSELESKLIQRFGTRDAIYVSSGSSANLLAVYALLASGRLRNLKAIAPAISWVTTVAPLIQFGFETILCDCSDQHLGLDPYQFERLCQTHRPSIAVVVHVLGHDSSIVEIKEICDRYDVFLIEDACEAIGSEAKAGKLGTFGAFGTFSLYYSHQISSIEGGILLAQDPQLAEIARSLRAHGWARDLPAETRRLWESEFSIDEFQSLYTFYFPGFNCRSTDVNAYLAKIQIDEKLDLFVRRRAENFDHYASRLKRFWRQASETPLLSSFAYGLLVRDRLGLYKRLSMARIESRPLICGSIARQPFWIKTGVPADCPRADIVHDHGLYLPNHASLSKASIDRICDVVEEFAEPVFFPN